MTLPPSLLSDAPLSANRSARRDAEAIRHQAAMLDGEQQAFLEMIFDRGTTLEQIAQLTGQHISTISRRFGRLMRKLAGPRADTDLGAGRRLTPMEAAILREYYLHGIRQRIIAQKLGCSRYRVRHTVLRIRRGSAAAGKCTDRRDDASFSLKPSRKETGHVSPECLQAD
jgi:DNA-directed RNA polymerase specialized sigma24 family protein